MFSGLDTWFKTYNENLKDHRYGVRIVMTNRAGSLRERFSMMQWWYTLDPGEYFLPPADFQLHLVTVNEVTESTDKILQEINMFLLVYKHLTTLIIFPDEQENMTLPHFLVQTPLTNQCRRQLDERFTYLSSFQETLVLGRCP